MIMARVDLVLSGSSFSLYHDDVSCTHITFVFNGSYTGILHFGLHYSFPYSVSLYVLVFTCALIYVASSRHYRH